MKNMMNKIIAFCIVIASVIVVTACALAPAVDENFSGNVVSSERGSDAVSYDSAVEDRSSADQKTSVKGGIELPVLNY